MLVVAGPPGSGKTTSFPVTACGIDAFSIDDRCAQIVGSYRAISPAMRKAVSQECEDFVSRHIEEGRSFAVETTLRTEIAVRQAEAAQRRGFHTEMLFLCTASPDVNVQRVLQRAQSGGHAASESDIRTGHSAALRNLVSAERVSDRCVVYDTSAPWTSPRLAAVVAGGKCALELDTPAWVRNVLRVVVVEPG